MTDDLKNCPNCDAKLATAFSSNPLISQRGLRIINFAHGSSITHACGKCGDGLYESATAKIEAETASVQAEIKKSLNTIPILSTHSPQDWSYQSITIVTAQTVTGTGLFSEFTSGFTDLFGVQSNAFNKKLKAGEELCKSALRLQTARVGGNAVIATDIDYGEVGGVKAMLMVCMTGTAVRVLEDNLAHDGLSDQRGKLSALLARLDELEKFTPSQYS